MRKKEFLIFILIVFLLTSLGCNRTKKQEPREISYRTGTQGLVLNFPADTPTKIYEHDNSVSFIVEVRNKGAFPQPDEIENFEAYLWIGGFDNNILEILPKDSTPIGGGGIQLKNDELEGKTSYNPQGGYSAVEFEMSVMDLPQGMPFYRPKIIVTATYKYQTIASPMICVDPEPRSTRIREKVCDMDESVSPGSQGAPIAVTKIEQDVTSDNILFKIFIRNMGNGIVIPDYEIDKNPNKGYDWRDLNKVFLDEVTLGNIPMTECRPRIGSEVNLINGEGYIFCRINKDNLPNEAYQTPINIILSYGYANSIEREIEIFEEVSFD